MDGIRDFVASIDWAHVGGVAVRVVIILAVAWGLSTVARVVMQRMQKRIVEKTHLGLCLAKEEWHRRDSALREHFHHQISIKLQSRAAHLDGLTVITQRVKYASKLMPTA